VGGNDMKSDFLFHARMFFGVALSLSLACAPQNSSIPDHEHTSAAKLAVNIEKAAIQQIGITKCSDVKNELNCTMQILKTNANTGQIGELNCAWENGACSTGSAENNRGNYTSCTSIVDLADCKPGLTDASKLSPKVQTGVLNCMPDVNHAGSCIDFFSPNKVYATCYDVNAGWNNGDFKNPPGTGSDDISAYNIACLSTVYANTRFGSPKKCVIHSITHDCWPNNSVECSELAESTCEPSGPDSRFVSTIKGTKELCYWNAQADQCAARRTLASMPGVFGICSLKSDTELLTLCKKYEQPSGPNQGKCYPSSAKNGPNAIANLSKICKTEGGTCVPQTTIGDDVKNNCANPLVFAVSDTDPTVKHIANRETCQSNKALGIGSYDIGQKKYLAASDICTWTPL
jgi:hypothetical protein